MTNSVVPNKVKSGITDEPAGAVKRSPEGPHLHQLNLLLHPLHNPGQPSSGVWTWRDSCVYQNEVNTVIAVELVGAVGTSPKGTSPLPPAVVKRISMRTPGSSWTLPA